MSKRIVTEHKPTRTRSGAISTVKVGVTPTGKKYQTHTIKSDIGTKAQHTLINAKGNQMYSKLTDAAGKVSKSIVKVGDRKVIGGSSSRKISRGPVK